MNPYYFTFVTKLFFRQIVFFPLFLCSSAGALSQAIEKTDHVLEPPRRPVNCEMAQTYINDALIRYSKHNSGYLIVIARPGAEESSARRISQARLSSVKTYVSQFKTPIKTVFAEGASKPGFGAIEIYVNGDLLYSLPIAKREGLDLTSCLHA
jgi:hypothetical protein